MITRSRVLAALSFGLCATFLHADEKPTIELWPNGAPGERGNIGPEKSERSGRPNPVTRVTNVTVPRITLYRADSEKATGCGVVIFPGGGYNILAYDKEGTEVAEWFNSIGVTAVVLKYRVPRRDPKFPSRAPLQDAQRAIRLVRQNSRAWGIDSNRLGVLGFSAGGHLCVMAGTRWTESTYDEVDDADKLNCRPDFMIPIYAAYLGDAKEPTRLSELVRVTERTPPTFLAVTYDDKWRGLHAALLFAELKKADVPAEVHVYSRGGHGYGLRPSSLPVSTWHHRCHEWLMDMEVLGPTAK